MTNFQLKLLTLPTKQKIKLPLHIIILNDLTTSK